MTTFRRFFSLASASILAAAVFLSPRPASATNYALCTGINNYDQNYIENNNLNGCVPDARHMTNLITSRGEWSAANVSILTDSGATLTKIRQGVSNYAAKAKSGDKFLYYHSSHGGNDVYYFTQSNGDYYLHYGLDSTGVSNYLCCYNTNYTAKMMATDLAAFPSGVEIVVMMDTCHSAGMFKYNATTSSKKALASTLAVTKAGAAEDESLDEDAEPAAENSAAGFFMAAVMEQLEQVEAEQVRRGLRPRGAKSVASNVGWIAAADYDQYSLDAGTSGGAFTVAFINGVTNQNKMCDNATYGNQDGYASFYEGWNYAKDIARGARDEDEWGWNSQGGYYDYNWADPQCANTNVLKSVLIGWAGKTAPANVAPSFPSATATASGYVNGTVEYTFSAAGSPAPSYTLSTSVSTNLYDFENGYLLFTPAAAGTYTFTCTAANDISPNATCTLTVTVTLPPPETPSTPSVVGSDSFTATWTAVSGASRYELVVVEGASGGGSGATVTETFDNVSFSTSGSSYANQTISGGDLGTWTATQCRGDKGKPVFRAQGTLASPSLAKGVSSVEFDYDWPFTSDSSGTCDIDLYVNDVNKGTATVTVGSSGTASYTSFDAVSGAATIMFTNKAASDKRIRVTEVRITTAGSARALPRATGDVVFSNSVGNVTSYQVTGLQPDTTYSFSYRAIVNGEATPWSEPATVTTAEGDVAPAWFASFPATGTGEVDEIYQLANLSSYVSGSPTPAITVTAPVGVETEITNDTFRFLTDLPGDYSFTFTASNTEGTATANHLVTISAAPVTVPVLMVDDATATTAYATWSECTGVTTYTLQLASDNQFTTGGGGSGGSVTLFSNDGTDATSAPSGWTYNVSDKASAYLLMFSGHSVVSEAVDASACTDLSVSLYIRTYGGTSQPNLAIQYSTDNGSTWTDAGTVAGASSTMAQRTLALPGAAASSALRLRFAPTTTSSSVGVGIKTIVLTGTESASGTGSLIAEYSVSDDEYTFTGLSPYTVYYARVKGNAEWSNVAEFLTDTAGDSAPVWSATFPSAVSTNVGDFYTLANVSSYVSGSPAPSISLSAPAGLQASLEDDTFLFGPEASGSYTFTFTASNSVGTATATLVVTAVGQAPALTASQGTSVAATVGDPVSFTVTATGIPAPTVTMAATEYAATFANGAFSFTPAAAGTYAFTFNASNGEGNDTLVVTVTASAAPVTIPELTVTNVTDTTALAFWTACDGVSSYTLQLSTNDFPAASGAARSATPILSDDFSGFSGNGTADIGSNNTLDLYTATTGWTGFKVYTASETVKVGASSGQGWLMTPALDASGTLTVVWSAYRFGTSDKNTLLLGVSDNGTDFDEETITLGDEMAGYTNTFTVTGPTVYVRWMASGSSKARFYLDDVSITNPGGGSGGDTPAGDDIQEFTVSGTSHTFTNLSPYTVYYARVKGDSYWSNTEDFITDEEPVTGTAPSWSASFPTNWSMTAGDIDDLDLADYVSGAPSPSITLATDAPAGDYDFEDSEFTFLPTHTGTFTFTFTASNSLGTADAVLVATVSGTVPSWDATFPTTATVVAGENYQFGNVSSYASGNPPTTVALTSAGAEGYTFADDTFRFSTATPGTYAFVFTASNVLGTADATLTVTVTEVPVVTVPPTLTLDPATIAYNVTAGDPMIYFTVAATGTPDPTVTATCTEGASFEFDDGEFVFDPATAGIYHFVFTAANSAGSASATVTVTVAEAEVPIPTLVVTNITDTNALASWTACTGVSSYRLQLATDTNFTAGGFTSLLAENFDGVAGNSSSAISSLDGVTAVSGWTCANTYSNTGCLRMGKGSGAGSLVTPSIEVSGTLRVVWSGVSWTNDDTHVYVGYSVNGTDFTELEIGLTEDMVGYTNTFEIAGTASLQVRWRSSKASNQRFFIDDIAISGGSPAGGASGSLVFDQSVTGTSHTFTGLTPFFVYYARVKVEDAADWAWSPVVEFITEESGTPPQPLSDFEQWLADHDAAGAEADWLAGDNEHTFWEYYVADIDPYTNTFLEVSFTAAGDGTLAITPEPSANRTYELIYWTDLTAGPVTNALDISNPTFPMNATGFGRVLVTLPSSP